MGIQTKIKRVCAARVFPRLTPVALNSDWFIVLFTSVTIGQSNYFGFGFTTLNWKPLQLVHCRGGGGEGLNIIVMATDSEPIKGQLKPIGRLFW